MKIQSFYRTVLVGALTLTLFLLVAALLMTTRSTGAILPETTVSVRDSSSPTSPSAVTAILLPRSTAAYNGVITPATTLHAPWLLGSTSVIRVYNAGDRNTRVQASITDSDGLVTPLQRSLAAGAVVDIQTTAFLTGTRLSATLVATQPLVAVINDFGPAGVYATSYAAMPASLGQGYLALPDIYYQALGGWDSDVVIQNVGGGTANVTIVYTKTNEPLTTTNWVDSSIPPLAPGEVYKVDFVQTQLPEKFVGIASVIANRPLIAVVQNAAFEVGALFPRHAYVYRVPLPGTASGANRSLYYPFLFNAFGEWTRSEIQIMNAGSATVSFTLEIDDSSWLKAIEGWSVESYLQSRSGSQSPPGEAVAGRVENAQTLQSLVWLNGLGGFIGDSFAAYSPPGVGGRTWYLPYTDQSDSFATLVAVQNLSDEWVTLDLTPHTLTGTLEAYAGTYNIAPAGMDYYAGGKGLPSDFVGGLVVEADGPVAAVTVISGRLVLDQEINLPILMRNY